MKKSHESNVLRSNAGFSAQMISLRQIGDALDLVRDE